MFSSLLYLVLSSCFPVRSSPLYLFLHILKIWYALYYSSGMKRTMTQLTLNPCSFDTGSDRFIDNGFLVRFTFLRTYVFKIICVITCFTLINCYSIYNTWYFVSDVFVLFFPYRLFGCLFYFTLVFFNRFYSVLPLFLSTI